MTIKEQVNLLFFKSKCIKVIIIDVNKRLNSYIIRVDDKTHFSIGERSYAISYGAVYVSKGIPAYVYYFDNPSPVTKEELVYQTLPVDIKQTKTKPKVSSADFYNAIEESLLSKIIRYAEDGDKKIINTILMVGGANLLVVAGGIYFLYTLLDKINVFISENENLLELIKDALIRGVGN